MKYFKIIFFLFFLFLIKNAQAQLKESNFFLIDSLNRNVRVSKITKEGNKFLHLRETGFKREDDLTFVYYNKGPVYCCNYYEVKSFQKIGISLQLRI